jgi:hypothetical protein
MKSVGKAAFAMSEEVRHQFRTIPGIMEGTGTPDYERCVAIERYIRSVVKCPDQAVSYSEPGICTVFCAVRWDIAVTKKRHRHPGNA